ncbi:MAG: response regulator [Phycisphaerae bacterium]|nr:response regulator [Phycisphaerae bacterium]
MNVLIAEDNGAHRELLEILIRSGEVGSQITAVDNGADFIRTLANQKFDVALLDYHLPDCVATEIFPQLDQIPNRPPVIVVSSDADSETIIAALRSGGRDFLPKNEAFQAAALIARIRAVLRRQREEMQLIERQKDECIAALAGGLAHDFNNMLVGILGKAALLRDEESRDKKLDYCNAIIRTGERLADLAKQLLAYARGGKYNPRPTNINAVIEDTLAMLKGAVSQRLQIRTFLSNGLWDVHADRSQLVQALLNLCLNGCEAMGREGTLSIFTESVNKPAWQDVFGVQHPAGEYLHLVVADTGSGISDNIRSTMFEPYHSTKGDGRGLGLAAVKGILKTHAGGLLLNSEPGRGTAFHIFLPRPTVIIEPPAAAPAASAERKRARVLVVEDEPEVREVVCEVLQRSGHEVSFAENGGSAVEALRRSEPLDLVLIDMRLPDCSGVDVLRACRRERPDARVILCSGYERVSILQEVLREFDDVPFLSKPFLPDQLLKAVDAVLAPR